jgi:hypothetical protein
MKKGATVHELVQTGEIKYERKWVDGAWNMGASKDGERAVLILSCRIMRMAVKLVVWMFPYELISKRFHSPTVMDDATAHILIAGGIVCLLLLLAMGLLCIRLDYLKRFRRAMGYGHSAHPRLT